MRLSTRLKYLRREINIREWWHNTRRDVGRMRGTNVWIFILYGLLFDTAANLWRPFALPFLNRLGGTELHITLLNSLPGAVAAIVLLPGALLFRRFANQKRATAIFILVSRALILVLALIPTLPPYIRPMLFVVMLGLMNCPDALSQTSLQSFLGTVFNGNTRGQAIALRTKFGQAIIPIVSIITGLVITFVPRNEEQRMMLYQGFFILAFLVGVLEVRMFTRLKTDAPTTDAPPVDAEKPKTRQIFRAIFANKQFRLFFVPALIFMFSWQAGWPLFGIYQVRTLQATELWFSIFALMSGISAVLSGGLWQKWLRKYSNNTIFVIAGLLLATNTIIAPFVPTVQAWAVLSLFMGISAVGINTALLNGVLEATPDDNRMMYLAFYNTMVNISLFIAPFFAHAMYRAWGNMTALFVVSGMRIVATGVVWWVHRKGQKNEP
ncbi:MAG: MFS transporter [Defluviitaleaceae bacterium]|nr:MFS transporter [Defluviitaleaceae bacterium]MCL2275799.1 MFS transporter [Defluviitaleaceae bacterium]